MPTRRERILSLHQRSFDFTCGVVNAYPRTHQLDDASRVIWHQLLKAAASATLNLEEADAASSGLDFVAKMRIALREAKESRVAIRIIVCCQLSGWNAVAKFEEEAGELAAIFAAIIIRKKANMAKPD
jgi:four helix bundle protein